MCIKCKIHIKTKFVKMLWKVKTDAWFPISKHGKQKLDKPRCKIHCWTWTLHSSSFLCILTKWLLIIKKCLTLSCKTVGFCGMYERLDVVIALWLFFNALWTSTSKTIVCKGCLSLFKWKVLINIWNGYL